MVCFNATTLWHFDTAEWAPSTASIATFRPEASPTSLSARNRRVLFDELALLQLRPELRRDLDLHGAVVSDNLLLAGVADNQGQGDIRRCGELQRRRPEIDTVPSRYLAQHLALFDDW